MLMSITRNENKTEKKNQSSAPPSVDLRHIRSEEVSRITLWSFSTPVMGDGDSVAIQPGMQRSYVYMPRNNAVYDGKRMRQAVTRKTVDFNSSSAKYLEVRFCRFTLDFASAIFKLNISTCSNHNSYWSIHPCTLYIYSKCFTFLDFGSAFSYPSLTNQHHVCLNILSESTILCFI
jgi:hypothetical protein